MTSRKPAGDTVASARTETMHKGRQADSPGAGSAC